MPRLSNILMARDFSASSDRALRYALDLARRSGATLHVVHAAPAQGHPDNVPPEAEIPDTVFVRRVRDSVERQHEYLTEFVDVRYGIVRGLEVAPAIVAFAQANDIDLIVTGTRARTGLRRLLGPSVAAWITRLAPCPVSVVSPNAKIAPARRTSFDVAWSPGLGMSQISATG